MRRFFCVISGLILFAAAGCVANKAPVLSSMGTASVVAEYRERALSLEKQGDVQQAIFSWQIIRALRPEDKEVQEKIATLEALARQKASEHYLKAKDLAERGEWNSARHQAVISLRYDPNHLDALALLNEEKGMIRHRVQSGETLASIAEKYYRDPARVSIVAYFSDLPSDNAKLVPGTLLKFPRLPVSNVVQPKAPSPEMDALLAEAREKFRKKRYRKVIVLAEKLVGNELYELEALFLLNSSYLALGSADLRKEEYGDAENNLKEVEEGFPGLKEVMLELERQKRILAEEHYRQGVKFYLNENLIKAIREWELTLKFYPDHIRASQNINKAQAILEKLKAVR